MVRMTRREQIARGWSVVVLCGFAAVLMIAGCHRNISGSYLSSDKSAVIWLQVVRTPDNHLTGQMAATALKPDGSMEQNSAPITGAVDGEDVTISGSRFFGLESFTFSGTLKGDKLTLTGAQSAPMVFTRSSLAEFQAANAELNARSQTIIKSNAAVQARLKIFQAQSNFAMTIYELVGKMARFDSEADVHLGRFPDAEKGYEAITAKVGAYVARERQLAGNPNASVTRGQLSVAANQASNQTEQMHNQGESLQSSLDSDVKPMADKAAALEQQCHTLTTNTGTLNAADIQNVNTACGRLESAATPFRQKYSAMSAGLAHLEQVYQRESKAQRGLIQEADKLE
jgi:hypothetical protein